MLKKPTLFLQFAGQGVKYMDELRRLYQSTPTIRPFIDEAVVEIKRQAASYDDSRTGFFHRGLAVDRWIAHPEETPDNAYLLSSPLSHPLIYLCQMATYRSILEAGIPVDRLLAATHSATGFSTGVVAALVAVSRGTPAEMIATALRVQAMFFWQGVRCQQSLARFGVRPQLDNERLASNEGSPSCMAGINGISAGQLEAHRQAFSDYGVIHPAYELMSDRFIVAGLPESLAAFRLFLIEHEPSAVWKYIPSTIAAHCPFLRYALETSPADARRVGLRFDGQQLRVPVWSNDNGTDLRQSEDIIDDVMRAYFTRPANWRKQIAPLLQPGPITHVLDFGPGAGVASLTESHLAGSDIQVIRCTVPLGRKRFFEEVAAQLD
jgi:malonyl CoA-acyl carrier protein transacylase